jgi:osmotically-inducible protein OsmY
MSITLWSTNRIADRESVGGMCSAVFVMEPRPQVARANCRLTDNHFGRGETASADERINGAVDVAELVMPMDTRWIQVPQNEQAGNGGVEMIGADTTVQDMVMHELRWDSSVDSANVGVSADHGAITLSGHVATYSEKQRAESAAKRVKGVRAVANELEVHIPVSSRRDDTDIAVAFSKALAMNSTVPADSIQATASKGWITLTGTVPWDSQRLAAGKIARDAYGVIGVTDNIALEQRAQPHNIEHDIKSALYRLAGIDGDAIHVAVSGGVATLTGRVSSWQEMTVARRAAAAARGVHRVDVQLRVEPASILAGV